MCFAESVLYWSNDGSLPFFVVQCIAMYEYCISDLLFGRMVGWLRMRRLSTWITNRNQVSLQPSHRKSLASTDRFLTRLVGPPLNLSPWNITQRSETKHMCWGRGTLAIFCWQLLKLCNTHDTKIHFTCGLWSLVKWLFVPRPPWVSQKCSQIFHCDPLSLGYTQKFVFVSGSDGYIRWKTPTDSNS